MPTLVSYSGASRRNGRRACRSSTLSFAILTVVAGTAFAQGGPYERQRVDNAAADRGRAVYTKHCINCHGSTAKGTDRGPDLIRSTVVLRDRLGNGIGPALKTSANHQATLSATEIVELSHFLHQRVEAVASNRNPRGPLPVLTGDPEAGRAYFNGAGRCSTCHSPAGDLAGIATRIADPANLQQRFLFPALRSGGKQVEVTVRVGQSPPVTGALVRIDDFFVSLRESSGEYRAFNRGPGVTVSVQDPLAVHHELLDRYTDDDMHNLTAYLARLK
jgi:cytochrome c oxidase cbb3-type subunit 3